VTYFNIDKYRNVHSLGRNDFTHVQQVHVFIEQQGAKRNRVGAMYITSIYTIVEDIINSSRTSRVTRDNRPLRSVTHHHAQCTEAISASVANQECCVSYSVYLALFTDSLGVQNSLKIWSKDATLQSIILLFK